MDSGWLWKTVSAIKTVTIVWTSLQVNVIYFPIYVREGKCNFPYILVRQKWCVIRLEIEGAKYVYGHHFNQEF